MPGNRLILAGAFFLVLSVGTVFWEHASAWLYHMQRPAAPPAEALPERFDRPAPPPVDATPAAP